MVAPRPTRIVDAHVHLWDPANTDWYPYLGGARDLGMGDVTGMARRFTPEAYAAEAAGWKVEKLVNVAAATGPHSVAETLHLDGRAEELGQPAAIIGGLPDAGSPAVQMGMVDAQMEAARFRGVRPMSPKAPPVPDDAILRGLTQRGLVFELMAHPPALADAAARLAAFPELTVVVEHAGWPRSTDHQERELWAAGIDALAAAGPHVHCKLSGLAMPLGAMSAAAFGPWIEHALGAFGVERCLFASNFPVDGLHGTLDQLWSAYAEVTAGCSDAERDALFATNAERVYRC